MTWPRDTQEELIAFYGNPGATHRDLVIWESANLVYVPLPWKAYLAWDPRIVVPAIRCHKKIAPALTRILADVWVNVAGRSQAAIEKMKVHLYGGGYMARMIRGGNRRSTHGFGCGIDWNPSENRMHTQGNMDPRFRACFEKEGAVWLKHDQMHVQFASSPKAMPRVSGPVSPPKPPTPPQPDEPPVAPVSAPANPARVRHSLVAREAWVKGALPLVKRWEGYRATRYWDVKQWAIGYGSKADHLPPDTNISEGHASILLSVYLRELADQLADLVQVSLTANQGAALLSFAYNLGIGALAKSTLLKLLNAADVWGAGNEFRKWVKAGGKTMPGLVSRRKAERELFDTP